MRTGMSTIVYRMSHDLCRSSREKASNIKHDTPIYTDKFECLCGLRTRRDHTIPSAPTREFLRLRPVSPSTYDYCKVLLPTKAQESNCTWHPEYKQKTRQYRDSTDRIERKRERSQLSVPVACPTPRCTCPRVPLAQARFARLPFGMRPHGRLALGQILVGQ